jgi:hypothetical protein
MDESRAFERSSNARTADRTTISGRAPLRSMSLTETSAGGKPTSSNAGEARTGGE